jgi:hypothetical protein
MERLILGIIAVICLHIAYVAYIYSDRPVIETAWNGPHPGAQPRQLIGLDETFDRIFPGGDIRSTLESSEETESTPADAKVRRSDVALRSATVARRVDRYSPPVDPDEISDRGPFKSVTIEIPRPYIPKMSVEPERPTIQATVQRKENRSFMASVLPVFKKPYSWIKALGSKLK